MCLILPLLNCKSTRKLFGKCLVNFITRQDLVFAINFLNEEENYQEQIQNQNEEYIKVENTNQNLF